MHAHASLRSQDKRSDMHPYLYIHGCLCVYVQSVFVCVFIPIYVYYIYFEEYSLRNINCVVELADYQHAIYTK